MDEPANGLDPFGIEELRKMIRSFAESGISVIISSHIFSEVEQVADDIGILHNGALTIILKSHSALRSCVHG